MITAIRRRKKGTGSAPIIGGCNFRRSFRANVVSNQVQTKIKPCRSAGGRQNGTVVDIQYTRVNVDFRMASREFRRSAPMRRCTQTVKRARRRQNERSRANRGNSDTPADRPANCDQNRTRYGEVQVDNTGNNDRIGPAHGRQAAWYSQLDMLGFDLRREAADSNIVERAAVGPTNKSKYLARTCQVTKHHSVERNDRDQVTTPLPISANWPKSYQHCLFSHWRSLTHSVGLREKKGLSMYNPSFFVIDYAGPAIGAALFVVAMSFVKEPTRRSFNAIFVAGASGVYLSGGFGVWELLYPAIVTPFVFLGLRSYRWIGVAWLMHACWDIVHHFWGNPIWPFMPSSAFGCMIFDTMIASWFLAGAPSFLKRRVGATQAASA